MYITYIHTHIYIYIYIAVSPLKLDATESESIPNLDWRGKQTQLSIHRSAYPPPPSLPLSRSSTPLSLLRPVLVVRCSPPCAPSPPFAPFPSLSCVFSFCCFLLSVCLSRLAAMGY